MPAPEDAPESASEQLPLSGRARELHQRAASAAREGDHAMARRLLDELSGQPGLSPEMLRVVRGARADLGPDPVAVVIGLLALVVTLTVWALSLR